jgi:hypothetical protein
MQLRKELLEISVAKKDQIRKLYAATDNLRILSREARQAFAWTLVEMTDLLKSIADI